ncbi:MAG: hypothetical protein R3B39_00835 [Candidatus Paceibacterota bacterium]
MLSIFSKTKILGIDVTEEYVRYSLISKNRNSVKFLSFGEEKIPRVEPKNALLYALKNIVNKVGKVKAHVSFPMDFVRSETVSINLSSKKDFQEKIEIRLAEKNLISHEEEILYFEKIDSFNDKIFFTVFISSKENVSFIKSVIYNSGLNVVKVVSPKDALMNSCVRSGEIVNTLVVNVDSNRTNLAIFSPFNRFKGISAKVEKEDVPSLITKTYQDFYEISGDKIGYFFLSGSSASDIPFLNYLGRSTRLPVQQANIFSNVSVKDFAKYYQKRVF